MARPLKSGLEYFPLDTDIFSDLKIRRLIRYQGGKAVSVYTYLLCSIYRNGYYMPWDDESPFFASESTGLDEAYITEAVLCCIRIGLFSQEIYDRHRVLTSASIQRRYQRACIDARRKCVISEFSCVSSEETPISSEETQVNSAIMQQRKEKERKIKEKNKEKIVQAGAAITSSAEALASAEAISEDLARTRQRNATPEARARISRSMASINRRLGIKPPEP